MSAVRWPRYISRRLCAAGLARRTMGWTAPLPRRVSARLAQDGGQAGKPWVPPHLFRRRVQ